MKISNRAEFFLWILCCLNVEPKEQEKMTSKLTLEVCIFDENNVRTGCTRIPFVTAAQPRRSEVASDPPHGKDAKLLDILHHIILDRKLMHLDNSRLSSDEEKAVKAPPTDWTTRLSNNTFYLYSSRYDNIPKDYILTYYPDLEDWDIQANAL
jgi:hypothetical protein